MSAEQDIVVERFQPPASAVDMLQQQRQQQLRRFNRLYVYLPLVLAALLAIGLLLLLAWATLIADESGNLGEQLRASGIADTFVTLVCLAPLSLLCLVLPAGGIFVLVKRRQRGSFVREPLQRLLWRADTTVTKAAVRYQQIEPKVVDPVIKTRSRFAYLRALLGRLRRQARALLRR